jgi:RHS repeat-associated protein
LTSDGVRNFTYDRENRLLTESGPVAMTLAYDPTGRLQQSVINGTTLNFLYDGDALVGEYNSAGTLLRRYVHGPEVDNPLVWFEGATMTSTTARYLAADRQGSIAGVANSSGAITANYTYDAYGIPSAWGTVGSAPRFRYTGQAVLPEAKLYYYKARVYDPVAGKFLQTDPVGDKSDLNLYAYVRDDPVNASDPSGDCPVSTCGVGGGALDLEFSLGPPLMQSSPDAASVQGTAVNQVTIGQYNAQVRALGINPNNISVDRVTLDIIRRVTNTADFTSKAQEIYNSSVASRQETGGIQVYQTRGAGNSSTSGTSVLSYANQSRGGGCGGGAAACETPPNIDPSKGAILFEFHPHPIPSEIVKPSPADLFRSLHAPGAGGRPVPGVIWARPTTGSKPVIIYYQGRAQ